MQFIIQMQDLGTLTFGQFCNRDAGPSGNDPCDLFVCYTVMYQRQIFAFYLFFFNFQLFLKFRQFAVLQLCCFVQIIASMPMVSGFSQLQLATITIAIAAGGTAFSHVNDSGFWLSKSLFEVDEKTNLKTWTAMETIVGIVGVIGATIVWFVVS